MKEMKEKRRYNRKDVRALEDKSRKEWRRGVPIMDASHILIFYFKGIYI